MKAKLIVDEALTLLSHVNASGVVDESRESRYYGVAPAYLTLLQYEIASCRDLTAVSLQVADLDADLALDDETALRLMPAGLAMYFALIDHDEACYTHFSKLYYESLLPSVKPEEAQIRDYYAVAGDPTMR